MLMVIYYGPRDGDRDPGDSDDDHVPKGVIVLTMTLTAVLYHLVGDPCSKHGSADPRSSIEMSLDNINGSCLYPIHLIWLAATDMWSAVESSGEASVTQDMPIYRALCESVGGVGAHTSAHCSLVCTIPFVNAWRS